MQEVWADVKDYENYYQVSDEGRVRSKNREMPSNGGIRIIQGRILRPQPNSRGYLRVHLHGSPTSIKENQFLHRLVAKAFVANPADKPEVNHKDCNFLNNKSENLEWVTHLENMRHAWGNGRFDNRNLSLKYINRHKASQVAVKGTSVATGKTILFESINAAGRYFGTAAGDICYCCKGKRLTARGYRWEYV